MTRYRIITRLLVLVLILTSLSFTTGCPDEDDDPRDLFSDNVRLKGVGFDGFVTPGTKSAMNVYCEPEDNRPEKPVYVWKIFYNGSLIDEIVQDSKPAKAARPKEEDN